MKTVALAMSLLFSFSVQAQSAPVCPKTIPLYVNNDYSWSLVGLNAVKKGFSYGGTNDVLQKKLKNKKMTGYFSKLELSSEDWEWSNGCSACRLVVIKTFLIPDKNTPPIQIDSVATGGDYSLYTQDYLLAIERLKSTSEVCLK